MPFAPMASATSAKLRARKERVRRKVLSLNRERTQKEPAGRPEIAEIVKEPFLDHEFRY
jgi:hypothetical protein